MRAVVATLIGALCVSCKPPEPPPAVIAPRPVTVIELSETDPVQPLLLTGSVESWKEQDVAFEVGGLIRFVVEPGSTLEGRWVEDEKVLAEGGILARLDRTPYEIARDLAAAAVGVAQETLATGRLQLEKVLPASLKAREAELVRAEQEWRRTEELVHKGAATEAELIRDVADRDARAAKVEEMKASIEVQRAANRSLESQVGQAEQGLASAEHDLARCDLQAPFFGEVSQVYIEAGGYAKAGDPVAHLVMMAPIKVDLAVSAATARTLERGEVVQIHVPGGEVETGSVYDISTTADPQTRTFRVSIITRNHRTGSFPEDDPRARLPRVEQAMAVLRSYQTDTYTVEETRALRRDDQGYFVWADPTKTFEGSVPDGTVFRLRKFRVQVGEGRHNLQGLYLMRELTDLGDLPPGVLLPLDVPDSDAAEQEVVLTRPTWGLRPGQLVPVLLANRAPERGLYLPMDAIRPDGEQRGTVFVAEDGKAKRVPVRLVGNVGEQFRVEGEGIAPGALVITDYVHFLQDGEPVRVIRRRGTQ